MEFFIDVDGVLLNFDRAFLSWLKKNYLPSVSLDLPLKTVAHNTNFDFEKSYHEFMGCEEFSKLPAMVDVEQFNWLSENYTVYLVTNLPNFAEALRIKNLQTCGFKYHKLVRAGLEKYGEEDYLDKGQAIQQLRSTKQAFFLDDFHQNCREVKKTIADIQVFWLSTETRKVDFPQIPNWLCFLNQLPVELPAEFKIA